MPHFLRRRVVKVVAGLLAATGAAFAAYYQDWLKSMLPSPASIACEWRTRSLANDTPDTFTVLVTALGDDPEHQTGRAIAETIASRTGDGRGAKVLETCLRLERESNAAPQLVGIFRHDATKMLDRLHADVAIGGDVRRSEIVLSFLSRRGLDVDTAKTYYRQHFVDQAAVLAFVRKEQLTDRQNRRPPYSSMLDVVFASAPFYWSPPFAIGCPFVVFRVCEETVADPKEAKKMASLAAVKFRLGPRLSPPEISGLYEASKQWPSLNRANDHLGLASLVFFASRNPRISREDAKNLLGLSQRELSSAIGFLVPTRRQGKFIDPTNVENNWVQNRIVYVQLALAQASTEENRLCGSDHFAYAKDIAAQIAKLEASTASGMFRHFLADLELAKIDALEKARQPTNQPLVDWNRLRQRLDAPGMRKAIHEAIYDLEESSRVGENDVIKALRDELGAYEGEVTKPRQSAAPC